MKGKSHKTPSGENRYKTIGGILYVAARWFGSKRDATALADKQRKKGYSARVLSASPRGYVVWVEQH